MGNPTAVAIIRTGGIAEAHIFAYQKEPERVRIVALADIDRTRAEAAGERFGIETFYDDYREVLKRPDVDAVSICTPPFTYVEIACDRPASVGATGFSQSTCFPARRAYCTALMRAKNNELGQFPVGCVPRDPLFAEQFKLTQASAVPAR